MSGKQSPGERQAFTDEVFRLIEKAGPIKPKNLSVNVARANGVKIEEDAVDATISFIDQLTLTSKENRYNNLKKS